MRTRTAITVIALSLACGAGGYMLRAQRTDGSTVLSLKDVVQPDYFASPDSFSRIANTKNGLDALSERLGFGIMDVVMTCKRLPQNTESERRKREQLLDSAIQAAEGTFREFEGTEQQLEIARSLLCALETAGRFDRWTDVYLKALHEHPTHSLVARLATDAVRISSLAGEQQQVLRALSSLMAFESGFAGRPEIEAALSSAEPCVSLGVGFCSAATANGLKRQSSFY